jgi:hypothetical protein
MAVVWLWLSVLSAKPAQARQEYPGELQAAVGMECAPGCRTCHILSTGGKNWNRFGLRLVQPVLAGESWPAIVAGLRVEDKDSDGDGRLDVYELEHDTDPSLAGNDVMVCPRYGCGARVAGDRAVDPLAGLAAFAALMALACARARSRRRT